MSKTLGEIEIQTKKYSDVSSQLASMVDTMEGEITKVKKKYLEKIIPLAETVSIEKAILEDDIKKSPDLFVKPRSFSFHGIKVGYQKKKGRIEIIDEQKTIELIEKKLEDKADNIILSTKSVIKKALETLDVKELKMIGCEVKADCDEVLIKSDRDKIEKFIDSLIKENTDKLSEAPQLEQNEKEAA